MNPDSIAAGVAQRVNPGKHSVVAESGGVTGQVVGDIGACQGPVGDVDSLDGLAVLADDSRVLGALELLEPAADLRQPLLEKVVGDLVGQVGAHNRERGDGKEKRGEDRPELQ